MTNPPTSDVSDVLDGIRAKLLAAHTRSGLSTRAAAVRAGMDPEILRRFLAGEHHSIQLRAVVRLALALGVSLRIPPRAS